MESHVRQEKLMAANTQSQGLLRSYVRMIQDCSVIDNQNAIEFLIRRGGVTVSITLPNDVQEWFVDVGDSTTGAKARDWYDYSGYDQRGSEELDRDMAQDLRAFVENVLKNPLRMRIVDREKAHAILEWQVDGAWKAAVPADARA
jgi:hypothetical protein